jgi:hypothetical protein
MHNPLEQPNTRTQASGDSLRRLPAELQPPYSWQEFQRRAQLQWEATNSGASWKYVAAAAALLLVVCGIAVWGRLGERRVHLLAESSNPARIAAQGRLVTRGPAGDVDALRDLEGPWDEASSKRNDPEAVARDAAVAARRARAIESWLATLPREPAVVRVGTRADIAHLEDSIAQVDDLLTSLRLEEARPDRLAMLQRERIRLVGSLAQVRYAEVLASGSP